MVYLIHRYFQAYALVNNNVLSSANTHIVSNDHSSPVVASILHSPVSGPAASSSSSAAAAARPLPSPLGSED